MWFVQSIVTFTEISQQGAIEVFWFLWYMYLYVHNRQTHTHIYLYI